MTNRVSTRAATLTGVLRFAVTLARPPTPCRAVTVRTSANRDSRQPQTSATDYFAN